MNKYDSGQWRRWLAGLAILAVALLGFIVGTVIARNDSADTSTVDLHTADWSRASVPASVCGGGGMVTVDVGQAVVSSAQWPDAWAGLEPAKVPGQVGLHVGDENVVYGDVDGDGVDEAVVAIWCSNGGGTAAGTLAQGLVVFSGKGPQPSIMGIITPTQPDLHGVPYVSAVQVARNEVIVEEYWYGPGDGTCCPSGRARTNWTLVGASLVVGPIDVTTLPDIPLTPPKITGPFDPGPCNPQGTDTLSIVACAQQRVEDIDGQANTVSEQIFALLSAEARRRFAEAEDLWWYYRASTCASRSDVFEGGSAADIESAHCFIARSEEHLAELTAFLSALTAPR